MKFDVVFYLSFDSYYLTWLNGGDDKGKERKVEISKKTSMPWNTLFSYLDELYLFSSNSDCRRMIKKPF